MSASSSRFLSALFSLSIALLFACGDNPPGQTYYEREIQPILTGSCVGNTGGCHAVDETDPFGFAAGNFDVTSFENVQKRRDVLHPFGAYGVPLLLIKAVGNSGELGITYSGEFRELEVEHVGGSIFTVGSDSYLTLLEWTANGATENGLPPLAPAREGEGDCSSFVPEDFDESTVTESEFFGDFADKVEPVLERCNAASCHGAPQSDFYITCGDDQRQQAFNFSQARAFVDDPASNSQLLQVPLAVDAGGYFHTGGEHFDSRDDQDYKDVEAWAEKVGRIEFGVGDPGKEFFAEYVQPVLLTRGCSFEACHSPQATNDFQLRSGSQGFFSSIALERNYEKLHNVFMAFEVPDARRGRAVAKTILGIFGGIAHRGGPTLETPGSGGAQPSSCPPTFDPATAPAYCVFQEWVRIEREQLVAAGGVLPLGDGDTVPIVYVDRQAAHVASPLEFDTYQPGSDLLVATATIGIESAITAVGPPTSLLDNCPGAADRGVVDVRAPDVRYDGTRVVFAMRTSAAEPLEIYAVDIDGANCERITDPEPDVSGIKIHNFDPAWSPDGEWLVYASTRGGEDAPAPSVSRRLFQPQSDIWRMRADGQNRERITFLTNSELSPQFMREGRIIMTTEKVSQGFYQLSGRRMNWDLTDYHPLLAQRAESAFGDRTDPTVIRPSVGYQQATEIREGFNGNFLAVFSDAGARGGAGTLAVFNRSVGPFELGRDDPGYLRSVTFPDPAATGRVGSATNGAYRSPFPLLNGRIMASYAATTGDLGTVTSLDFDVVAVDPRTGARDTLIGGPGAQVEAVLAIKHPPRPLYYNRRQLVFGGSKDLESSGGPGWAVLHFPDAPLIFTLLDANLRRGRPVELFRGAAELAVYREEPAPPGTTSPNQGDIFESRTFLGAAPLESDGSVKVRAPAGVGLILELRDDSGNPLATMREEHQAGPGESITLGIAEPLFNAVCGGCHGTVSGRELDVFVTPDVLTGASQSLVRDQPATQL